MDKAFVAIIEMTEKGKSIYGLLAAKHETWTVKGFISLEKGLDYFEAAYRNGHNRSYEGSMSATLNWIFFRPSIVELSLDEMKALVGAEPHVFTTRNVSGSIDYFELIVEKASPIWEKGTKPTLIKDEWLAEAK